MIDREGLLAGGNRRWDVVIAGARCAGAALGTLLARRGLSTLLLDRDRLPSDQPMSTHTIHPPGIDVLDHLGVGDAVRSVAPPSRCMRVRKNDAFVDIRYGDGRAEYCPRRGRLDALLQDAARSAGAEILDRTTVTDVVWRNGRVAGVRAMRENTVVEHEAALVVGADGRHSTIAQRVNAAEYLAYDAPRAMYWSYWDMPPVWHDKERFPFDMYIGNRNGSIHVIFQTDHQQLLLGSLPVVKTARTWRTNPLAALKSDLAADHVTAPLVESEPTERVRGTLSERYFFRQAAGPGWVLVGDAGHHKDFVAGDGITEALLQATRLAEAIAVGTDDALIRWWHQRDAAALPMFCFASDEGRPLPPSELQCIVFDRASRDRALLERLTAAMEHKLSPYDVFPPQRIAAWAAAAALRGRLRVLGEFVSMGKRAAFVKREVRDALRRAADHADGRAR